MTNPRKFADKLEIIRRKEEEANAAFDKIMQEVSNAKIGMPTPAQLPMNPPHYPHPQHMMRPPNLDYMQKMRQKFKGGSLPNVTSGLNPMDFPNNFGMNEPYTHQHYPGPIFPSKSKRSYTVHNATAPYRNNLIPPHPIVEQNEAQGGSMWRRTFSDSAIQQTLQQPPGQKKELSPQMASKSSTNGPRMIQTTSTPPPLKTHKEENSTFASPPPPQQQQFNGKHIQMQANTNSLPDLSSLSIPSPIQNPLDNDQENNGERNPFQAPYSVPRRPVGKQVYRNMGSTPDMMNTLQRTANNDKQRIPQQRVDYSPMSNKELQSPTAPVSPATSQPFFWNNQPMSPLVSNDMMSSQQQPLPTDLQQQLQQFQMQNEKFPSQNPPSYFEDTNGYDGYYTNAQYPGGKMYRMNGVNTNNNFCDRQLDSALMKVKNQNELNNEPDLNSVQVTLDPLDLRILTGDNTQIVDQSAEEQFRLERNNYI